MFEGSAADDRYLPFEGTGAVSSWRLSLPRPSNRFDFRSITDVVLQLRHTAIDGGAKLRQDVTRLPAMRGYAGTDFYALAQRYSNDWFQFLQQPAPGARETLSFTLADLVPDHVNRPVLTGIYLQVVTLAGVDASSSAPYIQVQLGQLKPVPIAIDRQDAARIFPGRAAHERRGRTRQHRVRPGCHARVAEDADRSAAAGSGGAAEPGADPVLRRRNPLVLRTGGRRDEKEVNTGHGGRQRAVRA